MGFSDWVNGVKDQAMAGAQAAADAQDAARKSKLEQEMAAMKLKYNPIEEGVDANGKPTFNLAQNLQLSSPEGFINAERTRQAQDEAMQRDQAQMSAAQAQAQARSGMASRGGLKGQNAALLSRFNMRDLMQAQQKVGQNAATQRAELESKGEGMKQDVNKYNIGNLLTSIGGVNQFELEKFKKMKDVEAAGKTADATRNSGGGGKK